MKVKHFFFVVFSNILPLLKKTLSPVCVHHMIWGSSVNWAGGQEKVTYHLPFCTTEEEPLESFKLTPNVVQKIEKASDIQVRKVRIKAEIQGGLRKKTWNSGESVFLSLPVSGPSARLWSGRPAPGAQCRTGQLIQLGCGSLLHRLHPARLRLLQSHRRSLWQQV